MADLTNPLTANGSYTLPAPKGLVAGAMYQVTVDGTFNGATVAVQTDTGAGLTTNTAMSFTAYGSIAWRCNSKVYNVLVSGAGGSTSVYVDFLPIHT